MYKWFDHLKEQGYYFVGYVIMLNHIQVLIGFKSTQGVSINSIVGESKRFMSYGTVKKLKKQRRRRGAETTGGVCQHNQLKGGQVALGVNVGYGIFYFSSDNFGIGLITSDSFQITPF